MLLFDAAVALSGLQSPAERLDYSLPELFETTWPRGDVGLLVRVEGLFFEILQVNLDTLLYLELHVQKDCRCYLTARPDDKT